MSSPRVWFKNDAQPDEYFLGNRVFAMTAGDGAVLVNGDDITDTANPGKTKVVIVTKSGNVSGTTGSGKLLKIKFTATASGTSILDMVSVSLSSPDGPISEFTLTNGQVVVIEDGDTTPPTIDITSPSDGAIVYSSPIQLTGTAVDNVSTITSITLDVNGTQSIVPVDTTGAFDLEVDLEQGENAITVTARDEAGNSSSVSISVTLEVGATPVITLDNDFPQDNMVISRSPITISGQISDPDTPIAEVKLKINGSSVDIDPFPENPHKGTFIKENIALSEFANTIEITVDDGTHTTTIQRTVTLFTLYITTDLQNGTAPLEVEFQAHTKQRKIILYEWDFDGHLSGEVVYDFSSNDEKKAKHIYTGAVTYSVLVHVMDEDGNENTARIENPIEVLPNPVDDSPNPDDGLASPAINSISADPKTGMAPLKISFSAEADDPDGEIALYEWDFNGDGVYDSKSEVSANLIKTYRLAGPFYTTLRVTDDDGLTATENILITVTENPNAPRITNFTANPITGEAPLTVVFTVESADPRETLIHRYEWDFDGNGVIDRVSNSPSVSYTYPNLGSYTASVVVVDENNLATKGTLTIKVTGTPPEDLKPPREIIKVEGDAPLLVDFKAKIGEVSGAELYLFDFNGDRRIDLKMTAREYNNPDTKVTHTYKMPGMYRARVLVTGPNGWRKVITVRIKAKRPHLNKVYIVAPKNGKTLAGTRVTIAAKVMPRLRKHMESLIFQYSDQGANEWADIGEPIKRRPFMAKWDTTLVAAGDYELRCVVMKRDRDRDDDDRNAGKDDDKKGDDADTRDNARNAPVISNIVYVKVDNTRPDPDIKENEKGDDEFEKEEKIKANQANGTEVADKTEVHLPLLAAADTLIIKGVSEENIAIPLRDPKRPAIRPLGIYREFKLASSATGSISFDEYVIITIPYQLARNLDEKSITIYYLDESAGEWKPLETEIYPGEKVAKAKTNHFSFFGLGGIFGGIFGGAGGGGAAGGSGGGGGGGCFIATAAYGTPMAQDVQLLCEFRDEYLMKNTIGRRLVKFYYRYSPPVADYIRTRPNLKKAVRTILKPVIWLVSRLVR